jgi:hypothetical protein
MIIDQERLVDGFRGMVGMDGSRDPSQITNGAAAYAVNCTFRGGGGPRTRPGFRQVLDSFWRTDDAPSGGSSSDANFTTYVEAAITFQGAFVYEDPRDGAPTQILVAVDGRIFAITLRSRTCQPVWGFPDRLVQTADVYFCQADRYVVIQDGVSEPLVYDGTTVRRASAFGAPSIPTGKQMAFGQGRLFVAINNGREIAAGDLIYSGSTLAVEIERSSEDFPSVFTTRQPHGFVAGDAVSISGHSSVPPVNGSYVITDVPSPTQFVVPAAVASDGAGGIVARFNEGSVDDVLRFSEISFLAEGGTFSLPSQMGRVKCLAFVPIQDDATGQGDLVAFCERGAASFMVSLPRMEWKATKGFQRVLFLDIGASSKSVQVVNGDIFFRSADGNGIRTYRSARAEFDSYGQTPMSAEIDPILTRDTLWMLDGVSFAYFDDRLLMTCWPEGRKRAVAGRGLNNSAATAAAPIPTPVVYTGIVALDFRSTAVNAGKSAAAYDGVWTGLPVLQLLSGNFDSVQRAFAFAFPKFNSASGGQIQLWELTRDEEHDTGTSEQRIVASVVPKAFQFEELMTLKKLLRCDVWFDDLGGGPDHDFEAQVWYRPDNAPDWIPWFSFTRCFHTETALASDLTGSLPYLARGYAPQQRSPSPPLDPNPATSVPAYLGYEFVLKIEWKGRARLSRILLHSLKQTEAVGGAQ